MNETMIRIGNFFFRYRNFLFMFLYALLFLPGWELFTEKQFGPHYYWIPITSGLLITLAGQAIRGATIGLAYIIRGGKDKKVYAEDLVTSGIFNHCRNPLYVGNILMLAGVGILSNSAFFICVMIPVFLFIYQAIVLAEEDFLRRKFGPVFEAYCQRVNRWVPSLRGLADTFHTMRFNWKRYILKEYNTFHVWLGGIVLLLFFKYPQLTGYDHEKRNRILLLTVPMIVLSYLSIRYLKKSGRLSEN
jgi:protein-S-isoprenylcysteine O-methyltransferase Ste14